MGILYIVATPIGNLQDITVRAAKLLTEISIIACEDTRKTGLLLDHLRKTYIMHPEIVKHPRLISYYEQNEKQRNSEILELLKNGQDIALVTDAGTPGISDPGFRIVRECREAGITVSGLPGPSAAILALSISGLPTDKFSFYGYLPAKSGHSRMFLEKIKISSGILQATHIIYEAPHKLVGTLSVMKNVFGDIEVVICRELTKVHEETIKLRISTFLEKYNVIQPKGEFVILWHF